MNRSKSKRARSKRRELEKIKRRVLGEVDWLKGLTPHQIQKFSRCFELKTLGSNSDEDMVVSPCLDTGGEFRYGSFSSAGGLLGQSQYWTVEGEKTSGFRILLYGEVHEVESQNPLLDQEFFLTADEEVSRKVEPGYQIGMTALFPGRRGEEATWKKTRKVFSKQVFWLEISQETFFSEDSKYLDVLRNRVETYYKAVCLSGVPRIGSNSKLRHLLLPLIHVEALEPDTVMCEQGATATHFFMLLSGSAVAVYTDKDGIIEEVKDLQAKEFFQLPEVYKKERYSVSVVTLEHCEVAYLHNTVIKAKDPVFQTSFESVFSKKPKNSTDLELAIRIEPKLHSLILRRLTIKESLEVLIKKKAPIFDEMSQRTFHFLCLAAEVVEFPLEHIIKKQGEDFNKNFYILLSGCVKIFRDDILVNTYNLVGDYFGQESILKDAAAVSTAVVASESAHNSDSYVTDLNRRIMPIKKTTENRDRKGISFGGSSAATLITPALQRVQRVSSIMPGMKTAKSLKRKVRGKSEPASKRTEVTNYSTCLAINGTDFKAILEQEPAIKAEIYLKARGLGCFLEDVLLHPNGRAKFAKFSQLEHTMESFDFINDVINLEQINKRRARKKVAKALGRDPLEVRSQKLKLMAKEIERIYRKYIVDRILNLPGRVYDDLDNRYEQKLFDFDMFSTAKQELHDMIDYDSFSRFKVTKEFQDLLQEVGAYVTGPEL
eukprot:augustus_masked-scaffold_6-processed-gene-3.1-mRNA-1 protein AED:1.00 eAED:1.00 QI:0/-1/0/0/-1/1/1/0/715